MIDFLLGKYPSAVKEHDKFKSYTMPLEEFSSLKHGAGLRICFNSVIIRMHGKDVPDFVHRVSTNSIIGLPPNSVRNTLFLNEKGRFIDRALFISLDNEYFLIGSDDHEKRLLSWINKFIIMEDIKTSDISSEYFLLELIGAQAESFLMLIIGKEISTISGEFIRKFYVDGFDFLLFPYQMTNSLKSYRILIGRDKAEGFIDYLFQLSGIFDLLLAGEDAFESYRIKYGIPSFPNEINDSTNPHEVNLLHEVNFKKGCYIGQEVIARLDTYDKVRRNMYPVVFHGETGRLSDRTIYGSLLTPSGLLTSISPLKLNGELNGIALINRKSIEGEEHLFLLNNDEKIPFDIGRF